MMDRAITLEPSQAIDFTMKKRFSVDDLLAETTSESTPLHQQQMRQSTRRFIRPRMSIQDKLEACRRVKRGESKASVGRDLGVPESTLRGWCKNPEIKLLLSTDDKSLDDNNNNNDSPVGEKHCMFEREGNVTAVLCEGTEAVTAEDINGQASSCDPTDDALKSVDARLKTSLSNFTTSTGSSTVSTDLMFNAQSSCLPFNYVFQACAIYAQMAINDPKNSCINFPSWLGSLRSPIHSPHQQRQVHLRHHSVDPVEHLASANAASKTLSPTSRAILDSILANSFNHNDYYQMLSLDHETCL